MDSTFVQVVILVEGQTEEMFVKELLCPYFEPFKVWVELKLSQRELLKVVKILKVVLLALVKHSEI